MPAGRKDLLTAATTPLSGVKLTDVDMEKQRAIVARQELERLFQGDPRAAKFVNFYVRPGMEDQADPELVGRMRLFTRMKKNAKEYHQAHSPAPNPASG